MTSCPPLFHGVAIYIKFDIKPVEGIPYDVQSRNSVIRLNNYMHQLSVTTLKPSNDLIWPYQCFHLTKNPEPIDCLYKVPLVSWSYKFYMKARYWGVIASLTCLPLSTVWALQIFYANNSWSFSCYLPEPLVYIGMSNSFVSGCVTPQPAWNPRRKSV